MNTVAGKSKPLIRIVCYLMISASFLVLKPLVSSAEFYGSPKVGLQVIASDRYGASSYVPKDYTPEKDWPLAVILYSDEAQKGEEAIQMWAEELKNHHVIALFVSYAEPKQSPFGSDTRLLKLMSSLSETYRIDEKRVMLAGFGDAAHYAFYMASRYPSRFSAVSMIAGSMTGRFDSLIHLGKGDPKSVKYLLAYGDQDKTIDEKVLTASRQNLEKQSYHFDLEVFKGSEHKLYPEFCAKTISWFESLQAVDSVSQSGGKEPAGALSAASSVAGGVAKG